MDIQENLLNKLEKELEKQRLYYKSNKRQKYIFKNDDYIKMANNGYGYINPKYMNEEQYSQIRVVFDLMRACPELNDADIIKMVNKKPLKFDYFLKMNKKIPNFIGEIREHGPYATMFGFFAHEQSDKVSVDRYVKVP